MVPSVDVALSGLQDATSVAAAILNLYAQGYRSIGIGRAGTLEIGSREHPAGARDRRSRVGGGVEAAHADAPGSG